MQWFEVDKQGLAKLLARKGKEFVLYELIQNAWDEKTSEVVVTLERVPGTRLVKLTVEDDNPDGFADLSHAFTLFAESGKKANAEKRGRFNLGEKLVLALCDEAEIASTRGTVRFDANGRTTSRSRRSAGSAFVGLLRMTQDEIAACSDAVLRLIAPHGIKTVFNGIPLAARTPVASADATLQTEIADAEGLMRKSSRKTVVEIHEPLTGETPMLYELGIPVVETGDRWHVNVMQKVPLNFDRDNVPAAYLSRVRAVALECMQDHLGADDANAAWVREAVSQHADDLSNSTIEKLAALRFGDKRVAYDPSDPEANALAVAKGYTVVHGGHLGKAEWEAVKRAGAILPAGQVTPSPKPFALDGEPLKFVPEDGWTDHMKTVVAYTKRLGQRVLGREVHVRIASDVTWPFAAVYGNGQLIFNLGRLGHRWFGGPLPAINELLIHEFGHEYSCNHLSSEYHDALCRLGAALGQLALTDPSFFALEGR